MREIKPLTGLRFVAAFMVLGAHYFDSGQPLALTNAANEAMTLFFCLSGFVLTWTYGGKVRAGRFAWARFARIYPLFALMLVVSALMHPASASAIVSHVLLVQAWQGEHGVASIFAVSWSLSVELLFYAAFPLLTLVVWRVRSDRLVWLAGLMVLASVLLALSGLGESVLRTFPPARLPDFVLGCVLGRMALAGWRAPVGATLPVAILCAALFLPGPFRYDAAYILPTGLLLLALTQPSRIGSVLGSRYAVQLGEASFALYLTHRIVHELVEQSVIGSSQTMTGISQAMIAVAAAPAAMVLAVLLHRGFEQPMRTWLRSRRFIVVRPGRLEQTA